MSNIKRVLVAIAITGVAPIGAFAAMPEELKGSWILDAEATEKYMKTSPKWRAADEKYLPTILKRMSQVLYEFKGDTISVSMRGKRQVLPVALKKSSSKKHVFEGEVQGKLLTMTVAFVDDATINIRSSSTDDMHYYLWKRGHLTDNTGHDDKSLAVEVMKNSLETRTNKPDAGDGK